MTGRPLTDAFPLRSDLALRAPRAINDDELRAELDEELADRLRVYPGLVKREAMTRDAAEAHLAAWRALIADHAGQPHAIGWEDRVRELRRELALRRTAYPKWIASPTNPLTEDVATRRLERLDALHWRYWMELDGFTPPGRSRNDNHALAAHLAERELARREPALDQAMFEGGAAAAIAERLRHVLIVLGRCARGCEAGRPLDTLATRGTLFVCADVLRALIAERIAAPIGAEADALLVQVHRLDCWLSARLRPTASVRTERLAA